MAINDLRCVTKSFSICIPKLARAFLARDLGVMMNPGVQDSKGAGDGQDVLGGRFQEFLGVNGLHGRVAASLPCLVRGGRQFGKASQASFLPVAS